MWMDQMDQSNGCKVRNRLTLMDRVKAIEAYEKRPVYQEIAQMFKCNAKQIRNIIKDKNNILEQYASVRDLADKTEDVMSIKQEEQYVSEHDLDDLAEDMMIPSQEETEVDKLDHSVDVARLHYNYTPNMANHEDESNQFKARNRLSLFNRVKVIQAYAETPIYHQVALKFNCSGKQIRNIIKNKEKILKMYESCQGTPARNDDKARSTKIALLGKIMYEWFLRARRNPQILPITYKMIQTAALQVKQILGIENFYPNNDWLMNFREKAKFTPESMRLKSNDPGPRDLDLPSIVAVVKKREEQSQYYSRNYSKNDFLAQWNDDSHASGTPTHYAASSWASASPSNSNKCDEPPSKFPKLEPIDVIEVECSDGDHDVDDDNSERSSTNNVIISNIDQALLHLKPLEDFALINEDFRAIGLISQLEAILKSEKKRKNFFKS